jgi:group I intron endonuclease
MASGIYFIVHRDSLKRYVGQAKNIALRLQGHWRHLAENKHDNIHLQNVYNKYGRDAFFEISTPCSIEDLTEREQYFIDTMWDMCYNICKIANVPPSLKGKKLSDEHKAKIGAAHKGKKRKPRTAEHRAKLGASNKHRLWQYQDEIRALRATGLSYDKIARKYICHGGTIRRICLS